MGTKKRFFPDPASKIFRYTGLAGQLFVSLGVAVWGGLKLDKWLSVSPLFICALPLLVLSVLFYKIIRETARKNKNEQH